MIPSSPLLAGLNVSYGIGEYSVRLQWQLSSDEDVDNYTLTLYNSEQVMQTVHTNIRSTRTTSQCVNSSWSPDPLTLVCVTNPIGKVRIDSVNVLMSETHSQIS